MQKYIGSLSILSQTKFVDSAFCSDNSWFRKSSIFILATLCIFDGLYAAEHRSAAATKSQPVVPFDLNLAEITVRGVIATNMVNKNYFLHHLIKQEGTLHLVAALCNAGIDPNNQEGCLPRSSSDFTLVGGNTPLHHLFFYRPKDLKEKTALLLLANANLEIRNHCKRMPLSLFRHTDRPLLAAIMAIKAAIPQVQTQRRKNRIYTKSLLTTIVTAGPAQIIDDYTFEPVWDDTCPDLFAQQGVPLTEGSR